MSREELGRKYPIVVLPYDERWPRLYEEEAARLRSWFAPPLVSRIEHIGSTAVRGLAAKPVIDLLVEIVSFEAAETHVRPALEGLGYAYTWRDDDSPGHMMFMKGYGPEGYLPGAQLYHLHMAPAGHPISERVLFRDHLRLHPEAAAAYASLKLRLAAIHRHDREAYTQAKTEFIAGIMAAARGGRKAPPPGRSRE